MERHVRQALGPTRPSIAASSWFISVADALAPLATHQRHSTESVRHARSQQLDSARESADELCVGRMRVARTSYFTSSYVTKGATPRIPERFASRLREGSLM